MTVIRRFVGVVLTFLGALWFVASAIAATMVVVHKISLEHRMMAVFHQKLETHYLSSSELQLAVGSALLGALVYGVGRFLRPGALGFWGRTLTSFGLLWLLLTGLCYAGFFASETFGAVFVYAFLIMVVGAFSIALGQTLRQARLEGHQ